MTDEKTPNGKCRAGIRHAIEIVEMKRRITQHDEDIVKLSNEKANIADMTEIRKVVMRIETALLGKPGWVVVTIISTLTFISGGLLSALLTVLRMKN